MGVLEGDGKRVETFAMTGFFAVLTVWSLRGRYEKVVATNRKVESHIDVAFMTNGARLC